MLGECKTLSIIITTSRGIKDLVGELRYAPSITLLKPLKIEQSVELFLQISGGVKEEEVYRLILEEHNYPIQRLIHIDP